MIIIEPEKTYTRRITQEILAQPSLSAPYPLPDIDPWEQPVLDYMARHPGKLFRFWDMPTLLAREFRTENRAHEREVRAFIMKTVLRLVRERKLVRHRRKWVRIHEAYADNPQHIIPLPQASQPVR